MKPARTLSPLAWLAKAPRQDSVRSVLHLLFALFFGRRLARITAELEALFAAWKAGTLPPIPPAAHRLSPRTPKAKPRRTRRHAIRVNRRATTTRHTRARRVAYPATTLAQKSRIRPACVISRHIRCRKTANGPSHPRTPYLLLFRNK